MKLGTLLFPIYDFKESETKARKYKKIKIKNPPVLNLDITRKGRVFRNTKGILLVDKKSKLKSNHKSIINKCFNTQRLI